MDLYSIQDDYVQKYMSLMTKSQEVKKLFGDHEPGDITVSTITMIVDFNTNINLENFNKNFKHPEEEVVLWTIELSKRRKKADPNGPEKSTFYNQTTLRFKDVTQKSIKIFRNGRLQMTGITSMMDGIDVAMRVGKTLRNTEGATSSNLSIKDVKIGMINTNFSLKMGLNLQILQKLLTENDINAIYDPDVYPGLKVELMPTGKVFIFGTGKVVITGAKDLTFIQDAYVRLHELLAENWNIVKAPMHTREKEKDMKREQIVHGYPKSQFESANIRNFVAIIP